MNKDLVALLQQAFGQLGAGGKYALEQLSAYYRAQAVGDVVWCVVLTVVTWAVVFKWAKPLWLKEIEMDEKEYKRYDWNGHAIYAVVVSSLLVLVWLIFIGYAFGSSIPTILHPTGAVFERLVDVIGRHH